MKDGQYATYQGREYEANKIGDDEFELLSQDPLDIVKGFYPDGAGGLVKYVSRSEVTRPRWVETWALHLGQYCQVVDESDDQYLLITNSRSRLDEALGFSEVEPGFYEKWTDTDEIDWTWLEEISM